MPGLLESSLFDTIAGLPVHPLVVHAAVVLLPVAALALVLEVLVPALRRRYGGLTVLVLAGGTAAAFVAKESGEALAEREGLPEQHALLGNILPPLAAVLLVVAVVWWVLHLRTARPDAAAAAGPAPAVTPARPPSAAATVAGLVAAVLALAVTLLTVLVGHSGATRVWGAPDASAPAASASPSPGASASPSASAVALTRAEVQRHASAVSCWAIVSGSVYDLTSWISQHPGGEQRILNLCGTDASAQFLAQHGTSTKVAQVLAGFKLGALAG